MLISVSFYCYGDPRDLHSFPTRRSSDLEEPGRQRLPTDRASRMALRVSLELADGPSSYQIRIERVPQRVAQQVDGHDGDEEGRAGEEREPVARVDELPALGEHAVPRRDPL